MPSADLLHYFQRDLCLQRQWWVNGKHYAKTCEDWLSKMLEHKGEIWPHLEETYGKEGVVTWWNRWQIFYMACAELFAYEGGDTWGGVALSVREVGEVVFNSEGRSSHAYQ